MKLLIVAQYGSSTDAHLKIFQEFSKNNFIKEVLVLVPKFIKIDKVYNPKGFVKAQKIEFENKKGKIIPVSFIKGGINFFSVFYNILKFKPDVIFVLNEAFSKDVFWTSWANIFAKIFCFWCKKPKIYFYGFENINKYYTEYTLLQKIIAQFIKRTVHYGIVCTDEALKILNEVNWYPKTKKIFWGVPLEIYQKDISQQEILNLKQKLNISENQKVIGYVGRFVKEKGIKDLVQAFLKLDLEAILIFIGDGQLRNYLEETSKNHKNIIVLPMQKSEDLAYYYKLMDVLVLPSKTTKSWKEQFGRVLIEAMACGTKLIGSNSGAIPEVIDDYGTIFKEGDIDDLKNSIIKELNTKRDKNKLLQRAKLASVENFVKEGLEFFRENENL